MADDKNDTAIQNRLYAAAESASLHALPSYGRFLMRVLRASRSYALYARARSVFSPTLWVVRVLRWTHRLLLIVETSALLLLAAALFLMLLPVLAVLLLSFAYAAVRERRRMNRRLAACLVGQRVLVLFENAAPAASLAGRYTVLVVGDKLPLRHPAAVACAIGKNVLQVREHYYFYLRRTLLKRAARLILLF